MTMTLNWPETRDVVFTSDRKTVHYFTRGQCNALAYEIWKLTGWPIGQLSDLPPGNVDLFGHFFVVHPNGKFVDIRGRMDEYEFIQFWPTLKIKHIFPNIKAFRQEMKLWVNDTPYDRDPHAARWARYIVDTLGS